MKNNKMVNIELKLNVEEKMYNKQNLIDGRDEELLDDFINTNNGIICDIISDIASHTEVYSSELHKNSLKIRNYINDLDFQNYEDLDNLFMAGENEYNYSVLNDNLDELIFNKLIHELKNNKNNIVEEVAENFDNINNGDLFTIILDDSDIENIISENNIDDDDIMENIEDYIRDYIIELIDSREIGEIKDWSKTGRNLYIPFEVKSLNKLKKFCKDGGLKPPTTDIRDEEIYYVTDSLKDTYKVSKA